MMISVKNSMKFGFMLLLLTVTQQVVAGAGNTCLKEYQLCKTSANSCCSGLNCSFDQCMKPCVQSKYCESTDECCDGSVCDLHYCYRYCKWPPSDCVPYKDICCSGQCIDGKCVKNNKCGLLGEKCNPITAPCCVNYDFDCMNGVCYPTCKSKGNKCDRTKVSFIDQCCSKLFCNIDSKCQRCNTYGESCRNNAYCCLTWKAEYEPVHCIQGMCRRPCFINGVTCTDDKDCCSDNCNYMGVCADHCSMEGSKCKTTSDCCNPKHVCGHYKLCQQSANCTIVGFECRDHKNCCLGFCLHGTCALPCALEGFSCITDKECCNGGHCVKGICQTKPCTQQGLSCKVDDDCCIGGSCQKGKCQNTCLPSGKQCKTSNECCDKYCLNGGCCLPDNKHCNFDNDCCSKYCGNGVCKLKCSPEDGPCSTSTDCCFSGFCVGGRCGKNCSPEGYTCDKPEECCSGKCVKEVCSKAC